MKLTKTLIATASLLAAANAWAVQFVESGDTGQTLATAHTVNMTNQIVGSVDQGTADLYLFFWRGGDFHVNTNISGFDTQLFLFNSAGQGLWANDDGGAGFGLLSQINATLSQGYYYIGVSGYNLDPYSAAGLIFPTSPFTDQHGPMNNSPLTHWAGGSGGGNYWLNFRTEVSEPSLITMLGLGLVVLGFAVRRRKA